VIASIEEKLKDAKVLIFKKRRRKNKSQRLRGYRRQIVSLRVQSISAGDVAVSGVQSK
jgi:ribosomal protein L21